MITIIDMILFYSIGPMFPFHCVSSLVSLHFSLSLSLFSSLPLLNSCSTLLLNIFRENILHVLCSISHDIFFLFTPPISLISRLENFIYSILLTVKTYFTLPFLCCFLLYSQIIFTTNVGNGGEEDPQTSIN